MASTNYWIGIDPSTGKPGTKSVPGSGNWSVAKNWSTGAIPANGDTIVLQGSPTYTLTLDVSTASLGALTINDSGATLAVGIFTLSAQSAISLTAGHITVAGGTSSVGGPTTVGDSGAHITSYAAGEFAALKAGFALAPQRFSAGFRRPSTFNRCVFNVCGCVPARSEFVASY
jgi:hypothetical protein